jgi:methionyl-tRNA formyltransferase
MRLTGRETALQLRTEQERANVRMLTDLIPRLADRSFRRTPQDLRQRTYFSWPREADYLIDFDSDAETVRRVVRAGYRHPGAHAFAPDGRRIVILSLDESDMRIGTAPPPPGTVRRLNGGWFVATRDRWLRIRSIDLDGVEMWLDEDRLPWPDSFRLGSRVPEEAAR